MRILRGLTGADASTGAPKGFDRLEIFRRMQRLIRRGEGDLCVGSPEEIAISLAVHESVCAERWQRANARLARIDAVLGATVLLLLLGEGSVVLEALKGRSAGPPARERKSPRR